MHFAAWGVAPRSTLRRGGFPRSAAAHAQLRRKGAVEVQRVLFPASAAEAASEVATSDPHLWGSPVNNGIPMATGLADGTGKKGRLHRSGFIYPAKQQVQQGSETAAGQKVFFPAPEALACLNAMHKEKATLVAERLREVLPPIRHYVRRPFSSPTGGLAFQHRLQGAHGRIQE